MKQFSVNWLLAFVCLILSATSANAAQQCINLSGKYQAKVQWYDAKHVIIDNAEPWNNKLVIHKTQTASKGKGRCGPDAETGRQVCEGHPVDPVQTDTLKPLGKSASCVNGAGDMFAVATCIGCTRGTAALAAGLGSIANLVLPGGAAFQVLGVAADAAGTNTSAAASAIVKTTEKSLKIKSKTKVPLVIHDISNLPNASDVVYVGTPDRVRLVGNFKTAIGKEAAEISNNDPSYIVGIDCNHSDIDTKISNTPDTITVEWWAGNQKMLDSAHQGDITCSNVNHKWTHWFGHKLPQTPTHIVVKTNGSNAFYIDQIELKLHDDGRILGQNLLMSSGADNGKGWCLSNDPNDIKNTLRKYADRCVSSVRFDVGGRTGNREKTCYDMVQGKIAWNTKGSKGWSPDNVKLLCKGVQNPQNRVNCFNKLVQTAKLPWKTAIGQCQKY